MSRRYTTFATLALAGCLLAGPAFSQSTTPPVAAAPLSTSGNAGDVPSPPVAVDSDDAFMTGLRRIGVMGGEVVQCVPEKERADEIADAMDLADLVATHFGLAAAFNFTGAVGYGSGKPFDKAGCANAISGWNNIKQKYLDQ